MDLDDILPKRPDDPLRALVRQDLDPMSVEELEARVQVLEAEIGRVKAKISGAKSFRSAADALFRKS